MAKWSTTTKLSTTRRIYGTLRTICRYAIDNGYITSTPCRLRLPVPPPIRRPIVDIADIDRLVSRMSTRDRLLTLLGVVAGLRWAEAAGATAASIDVDRQSIAIFQPGLRVRSVR